MLRSIGAHRRLIVHDGAGLEKVWQIGVRNLAHTTGEVPGDRGCQSVTLFGTGTLILFFACLLLSTGFAMLSGSTLGGSYGFYLNTHPWDEPGARSLCFGTVKGR